MSWFSVGAEAADQVAASMVTKKRRNFYLQGGERAVIRFLAPAHVSFNYKRCFVKHAPGEKMLTSPQTVPDPFITANLQLQASYAWWVIDRRILEFKDRTTGEDKKVGPRIMYFADGRRTQKQLEVFEKDMLSNVNEDLAEDGKDALTLEAFNLTSYDVGVSKAPKAPWNFTGKRAKPLSNSDLELIEKSLGVSYEELCAPGKIEVAGEELEVPFLKQIEMLSEELAPLPEAELKRILGQPVPAQETKEADIGYSYSDDEDEDTITFDE